MKNLKWPTLLAFIVILTVSSCGDKNNNQTEEIEIKTMDSTSKSINEAVEKMDEQTKKVESSLEKLDAEFKNNN
ncbi:MAG: hypothetical protein ABIP79_15205 [Chitinophagaceae bacterium]